MIEVKNSIRFKKRHPTIRIQSVKQLGVMAGCILEFLYSHRVFIFLTAFILAVFQSFWQFLNLRANFPPGPFHLPFIGNALNFDQAYPHRTFLKFKKIFGPVFTIHLPNPVVVIADFDLLKKVNSLHGNALSGRPSGYVYGIFTVHKPDGDGITLCQGERWSAQRRFALRTLRDFGMGKSILENKINDHLGRLLKRMDSYLEVENGICKAKIDLSLHISFCVGGIINDLVMGRHHYFGDPEFVYFKKLIDNTLKGFASPSLQLVDAFPLTRFFVPYYRQYVREGFAIQTYFIKEIQKHVDTYDVETEPTNFIDAYLKDMHESNHKHMSLQSLAIDSGDLWTGGMETTVTALRWAILYLIHYPEVQAKLHKEIDNYLDVTPAQVSERHLLPYVQATIDELLRITNVLPWGIPHQALEDIEVEGHVIRAGTTVMFQVGTVHFDESNFPEPNVFKPERFLDEFGNYVPHKKLIPFGIGKRQCLGESLARMEVFLIFVALVQNFSFHAIDEKLPSIERRPGMTCVPHSYVCEIRKRHKNLIMADNNQFEK
uniref:Cytochrome P450 n=1 Tax=Panagrellus redivivus TaxID=6233 RepID=A0A7E4W0N6_PANRE